MRRVDSVQRATQAWADAFNRRDVAQICACYHADAVLWGTTAQALIRSPLGIRQYFEGHCTAAIPLSVALTEQWVRVYGDMAISSGRYSLSAALSETVRALPARFSFTYRQTDAGWLIVDHHSSWVPEAPAFTAGQ